MRISVCFAWPLRSLLVQTHLIPRTRLLDFLYHPGHVHQAINSGSSLLPWTKSTFGAPDFTWGASYLGSELWALVYFPLGSLRSPKLKEQFERLGRIFRVEVVSGLDYLMFPFPSVLFWLFPPCQHLTVLFAFSFWWYCCLHSGPQAFWQVPYHLSPPDNFLNCIQHLTYLALWKGDFLLGAGGSYL
jgi:hypothetical protein